MICGVAQGLLIKKARARSARRLADIRRLLREHVEGCEFCKKAVGGRKAVSGQRVRKKK